MNVKQRQYKATEFRLIAADDDYAEDFGRSFIYFIICLACLFGTWGLLCLLFSLWSGNGDLCSLAHSWIAAIRGL